MPDLPWQYVFWMSLFGNNSNVCWFFGPLIVFVGLRFLEWMWEGWLVGVGDLDVIRFVFHFNAGMQWGNTLSFLHIRL